MVKNLIPLWHHAGSLNVRGGVMGSAAISAKWENLNAFKSLTGSHKTASEINISLLN
jgi:hypothetical protein